MRWFIAFLIVANVILFFWVQQQSRPLPGLASLPSPDIGRLRLLSEVDDEAAPDDSGAEPPAAESEPPTVTPEPVTGSDPTGAPPEQETPVEPLVAETKLTPEPVQEVSQTLVDEDAGSRTGPAMEGEAEEKSQEPPVQTGIATSDVVEAAATGPAVSSAGSVEEATEQAAEKAPEDAVEPVDEDLIEEPGQAVALVQKPAIENAEQEEAGSLSDSEPPALEVEQALCARVGPFESDQVDALIARLPASVTVLSDTSEDTAIVDRYYVLIPTLPSRAAGRKKLKELADAGVTDTWLFPSGEFRNAISLGFFSREGGAKRHAANIAKKGFTTEVRGRTSICKRRWLLLKRADGSVPASGLALPAAAGSERRDCP